MWKSDFKPIIIFADFQHLIFSSVVWDLGVTLDRGLTLAPRIHRLIVIQTIGYTSSTQLFARSLQTPPLH